MLWIEFEMMLWLLFCAEIILVLVDLCGELSFSSKANKHIDALLLMLSPCVSRCAGRIAENKLDKHITSMPAAFVFAAFLKHDDSVVLATYDLRWIWTNETIKFCRVSRSDSLPISRASYAMT